MLELRSRSVAGEYQGSLFGLYHLTKDTREEHTRHQEGVTLKREQSTQDARKE